VKTYYDPQASRGRNRRLTRNHQIFLGAAVAVAALVALMVVLGESQAPEVTQLVWVTEKTSRAPGVVPAAVRDRIRELGAEGGGRLTVYAVGNRAERIGSVDLDVKQDGDRVADPARQAAAVDRRLATLTGHLAQTSVGDRGFSLYQALRTGADEAARTGAPVEMWLSTTVLSGSTDPLSIPTLTQNEVDPSQAVDELLKGSRRDLDLHVVDLHIVLLTPVGDDQEPLNPRSESWRTLFIKQLTEKLGATVSDPLHDSTTRSAWANPSAVPAIVPLAEKTPVEPPKAPARQDLTPPRIDNAAFLPNEATLVNPAAAHQAVSQVVAAYKSDPGRYKVTVTGYCARFGDRDGAIRLSSDRAQAIANLLQADGVAPADITSRGVGFDELADPAGSPQSPTQRVVIIRLVTV
jgi:outer membrane protein OmpA-like peptidoglycan-associated protein